MRKALIYIFTTTLMLALCNCASRKHNTKQTRMYHSFSAKYNTYHNGKQAYVAGRLAQIDGHKDNYLQQIPLLINSNPASQKLGSVNFNRAIEKAQKAIKNHSIKKKPKRKPGQKLSEKERRFYEQKEFNPFMHKVWMMMANSQYLQGNFMEAAGTYIYMERLYATNPEVLAETRIRLSLCYSQLDWLYEAEELLSRVKRDSLPSGLKYIWATANANLLYKQERYDEAIPHIETMLKRPKITRTEKAREYYLLGQLYMNRGDSTKAFKYFEKVLLQGPLYDLEINARIKLTETMTDQQSKKIIRSLEKMIKQPKNTSHLGQLHYALGNVHMAAKDTAKAIDVYETGIADATTKNYGTGLLHLRLAEFYWEQGKFSKALPNYQQASTLLTVEYPGIETIQLRAAVLTNLVKHTDAIELQDNLLKWASMNEEELFPILDAMIAEVKRQEKLKSRSEKKKEAGKPADPNQALNIMANVGNSISSGEMQWYFYNRQLVTQGHSSFVEKWGQRPLRDYWRMSKNTIKSAQQDSIATDSLSTLTGDSIATVKSDSTAAVQDNTQATQSAEQAKADSLANDPTAREYYMRQIPRTDEQVAASKKILAESLYQAGIIYKEQLNDKEHTIATFERIIKEFPKHEKADEIYYYLYLSCSRWDEQEKAEEYRKKLITDYAGSKYTQMITASDFFDNPMVKRHKEDSLYAKAYTHFEKEEYKEVIAGNEQAAQMYPQGAHRARFMFLKAVSQLYTDDNKGGLETLKALIALKSKEEVNTLAQEYAKGLQEGRLLHSSITTSIWERRTDGTIRSGDEQVPEFSKERATPYCMVIAYPTDSLDEKRLLFEMARYNFTKYMVRNFEMEFVKYATISTLQIKEFLNFDEAFEYRRRLFKNKETAQLLEGMNILLISKANLDILVKHYSFGEYAKFYEQNFSNIPEIEIQGYTLDEPDFSEEEKKEEGKADNKKK
ncbi:MAG: tetratricopeptide repeat protein [Bacteroidales bacterium]|nr:tetratricopeptide repeat protein [Bacteroidales bacterium]